VREVLEQSPHLQKLELSFAVDNNPWHAEAKHLEWLPKPAPDAELLPLASLEVLQIFFWCPPLWEYLSRLGVKLTGVFLNSSYSLWDLNEKDPSGTVQQHILNVISGPRLLDFSYKFGRTPLPKSIQAAVFAHPRRYISCDSLTLVPGVGDGDVFRMEKLHLGKYPGAVLDQISIQPPPLRHLFLEDFAETDASLAMAIRAVSKTLEFLVLQKFWLRCDAATGCEQKISAIGSAQSLRRLDLFSDSCEGISHAMLEPLLFGDPPSQPPLCPKICEVYFELPSLEQESLGRIRDLFRQRCPYSGSVNYKPVCQPAVF
jgi:hypothetical protein